MAADRRRDAGFFPPLRGLVFGLEFAFINLKRPKVNTLGDARSLSKIAVYRNSRLDKYLKNNDFGDGVLVRTENSSESFRMLMRQRVDSWFAFTGEAQWPASQQKPVVRNLVIGEPVLRSTLWMVTSTNLSDEALSTLRSVMTELVDDGTLERIKQNYGIRDAGQAGVRLLAFSTPSGKLPPSM